MNKKPKNLADVIRESEQLQENIVHSQQIARMGSWTHDAVSDEIFFTKQAYSILGVSPKEFDGKLESFYDLVHPEDKKEVVTATQNAKQGVEYEIDYRIVTPSGEIKYVYEKTKAIYDKNQKFIKMIGILQDITKHKLLEANLKQLMENLNQAQRVAGVGSWKYNIIKDDFVCSDEMYRIFGLKKSIFKNDFGGTLNLIHPEDRHKMIDAFERHLSGQAFSVEIRIPKKDGSLAYILSKGEPVLDKEGKIVEIIGTIQDITENKMLEQKLLKSNKMLNQAQALADIGSWERDLNTNICYWSQYAYKIYGITPEQYDNTYEGFLKFVHPEDKQQVIKLVNNPTKDTVELEFRIIRPDGSVRDLYELVEFVFDKDSKPCYAHGTIQDITDKKLLEREVELRREKLDKIQRRFQILVQESSDVFEILDTDGTIKYISEATEKVIGYKPEERIGRRIHEFYEAFEQKKISKILKAAVDNPDKKIKGEVVFKTKSGKSIFLEVCLQNLINDPTIEGIVVNFRDISRRVNMEKRMALISTHDELTHLPNRIYFKRKLKLSQKYAEKTDTRFAVIMIELDGIKYANDILGYRVGDLLIIKVAKMLDDCLKESVCRYSGDRFAVVLNGFESIEEHERIANNIIELFLKPVMVDRYELNLSVNIGIGISAEHNQDTEQLIKHAEMALFWAKRDGKNTFKFYSTGVDMQNHKQLDLRNDLSEAIKSGQLMVYYQPIINLTTHKVLAAEALIRWNHPKWGMVSPMEFIPIAEETGQIINMGYWILRQVCNDYQKCSNIDGLKISVNFSSVQFLENNFVNNIKKTIDEFGLSANFLIMEITESVLLTETKKVMKDINELREYGIQIALDDFGTGYSSLSYLNTFNIDFIKIDSSFVKNIMTDKTSAVITKAIINMARELDIKLVAEGIETPEQLNSVTDCYAGQGYLFSKPLPCGEFEKIIKNGKCLPNATQKISKNNADDRRKFLRVDLVNSINARLQIKEFMGKKVDINDSIISVSNIGTGGLSFFANAKMPVSKSARLEFIIHFGNKRVEQEGNIVWEKVKEGVYEYGVSFASNPEKQKELAEILNSNEVKDNIVRDYDFENDKKEQDRKGKGYNL